LAHMCRTVTLVGFTLDVGKAKSSPKELVAQGAGYQLKRWYYTGKGVGAAACVIRPRPSRGRMDGDIDTCTTVPSMFSALPASPPSLWRVILCLRLLHRERGIRGQIRRSRY
jgi:hypothetical protein